MDGRRWCGICSMKNHYSHECPNDGHIDYDAFKTLKCAICLEIGHAVWKCPVILDPRCQSCGLKESEWNHDELGNCPVILDSSRCRICGLKDGEWDHDELGNCSIQKRLVTLEDRIVKNLNERVLDEKTEGSSRFDVNKYSEISEMMSEAFHLPKDS